MSKKLNSPVPRHGPPQKLKAAQLSKPLNAVKFADSPSTSLREAMVYFSLYLPKAFLVTEGFYSPRGSGSERLAEDDIFIAFLHKREVTLKVVSSTGNEPVTVSGTSFTEFALTPPNEDVTETVIANWEGLYSSVTKFLEATKRNRWPMPAALKVLNEAVDHNKQQVPAQTLLFNIREVSQKVRWMQKMKSGIEGVDCSGTVHQFLEGEDPLFFSTRLYDVKCIPLYFTKVVQFPQPARVYRHSNTEEGEEEDALENLSTITIAEVTRGKRLVVRKLDSRDQLGLNFTVPLDANLKVAAIRLQKGHLLDRVSDQRCMTKSRSCPNLARIASQGDIYKTAHFEDDCEVARGDVQAGRKRDHDMEACYSVDTLKLKQHGCGNVAGAVDIPGTSDRLHVMTDDSVSDDREYMKDRVLTGMHRGRKVPLSCPGSLLKGVSLPWKKRKSSARDEASLGYSPLAQARKEDSHFLPFLQNTEKYEDESYEEMVEDTFTQQRRVKSDHKLPQPQPYRPSPPVFPPYPDLSTKPKPKGVPSTAIPLVPAVCTRTRQPPPVPKKPIMLTSCPKEPELYFHVAAKLGLDWRKVCTYLGLQHYKLEQADAAHTKLEDKAMEALVMWLQGQGESKAPRSWHTLLQALHWAGHSDLASHVEKCIGNGTLQLS